ncbi:protein FAR1-related sequence 5 [Tanacetum coccineum]
MKARVVFNLDTRTRKFILNVFDTIHNHALERKEYTHLSKRERQLTYLEQAFIVKVASVNIGDSDAQMFIHKMENRKKHASDFSFDYLVENAELTAIFWADEVSKYNYREFGDVVSFDATFKTNKTRWCLFRFTAIDITEVCFAERRRWFSVLFKSAYLSELGILCKHIFCVFKNANVEMIPQQYILRRWTKNLIPAGLRNKRNRYGEKNVVVENYANEATSIVDHCVCNLLIKMSQGGKEKEIEKSLKDRNLCSLCGGTDHNKRTCPGRFEDQNEVVVQKEVGQEEVVVEKEVCQEEVV